MMRKIDANLFASPAKTIAANLKRIFIKLNLHS